MSQESETAVAAALWGLITEPAWIGVDAAASPLRTDARAWITLFQNAAAAALSKACGVSVQLESITTPPTQLRPAAGMVIHNGPGNPAAAVVFDIPAARALVDATTTRYLSLRGDGPLTAPEAGIAEFLALDVLDTIARAEPRYAASLILAQAIVGEEPCRALLHSRGRTPLWFSITCAGKHGIAAVAVDAPFAAAPELPTPNPSALASISLALPAFPILPEELSQVQPGDCILLGWESLDAVPGCSVVTQTGWSLGRADNVRDTAAGTTATIHWAACPEPFGADLPETLVAPATVCIGHLSLPIGQLAHRAGQSDHLVFAKDSIAPAWLLAQGRPIARGELCLVQGEAALRILANAPSLARS